ncbi:hypothetical protein E4634_01805 [Mangrovimicrobium sediminis]|uniref:Uncharacterized protein n=1 Tax=Mangrovimicrobium sediminis TaxID=2562682 RepID=A0A4Z0M8F2_9GAMM|nr:hypothetical protein [Haliea sp. SAOS-164]TGD75648.1 hypothetical protein E4634_01805 [Haliea sp. SAOS-164]
MKNSLMNVSRFVLGSALALSLSHGASAGESEVAAAPVGGSWSLEFCWDGFGCGTTSLDIVQFGPFATFTTGDSGSGVGLALNSLVILHYQSGCMPNYIAQNPSATLMSGRMKCTEGSTDSGTWTATKVAGASVQAAGVSSAGPR